MIYLAQYRTHQSVEELKATEKAQIAKHKLSGNVRKVYERIVRASFGNLGACTLKSQTIADNLGISRSTVTRCIKKLKDLHVIEVINDTKLNGIKGANIYSIIFLSQGEPTNEPTKMNHRATHETPRSSKVEHVKHETESFNSFKTVFNPFVASNVVTYCVPVSQDLKEQLKSIYNPLSAEGNQAFDELCKIAFGRLKQYMRTHNMPYLQMEQIVLNCMNSLVNKQGVRNQFAMYSKMIERQVLQLFEAPVKSVQTFNKPSKELVPDWYYTRNEPSTVNSNDVDYEAERQRILAKLG